MRRKFYLLILLQIFIFGCVSAGLGITLLPRGLVGPVWRAGRVSLHALPPSEALVTTVFIHRREAYLSSALQAFLAHVRATAEGSGHCQPSGPAIDSGAETRSEETPHDAYL